MSNSIGKNIKHYRKLKGMLQTELAKKCNISCSYISKIEAGVKIPSLECLILISNVLDVNLKDLNSNIEIPQELKIVEKPLSEYSTKELLEELLRRENEEVD